MLPTSATLQGGEACATGRLTARERSVLRLMAEGYSNDAIARQLVLSRRTVESHVARLFDKLGLSKTDDHNRRVLAVLAYLRREQQI